MRTLVVMEIEKCQVVRGIGQTPKVYKKYPGKKYRCHRKGRTSRFVLGPGHGRHKRLLWQRFSKMADIYR